MGELGAASCGPGANHFIQEYFSDCVYSARDLVGFALGLASIGCWIVAQVPQLIKNYRSKSAEALSAWFLAEWLLGDTCNLVGALLKGDQLPTVVYTAEYFICMDAVLLIQYVYYYSLQRRREHLAARRHRHHRHRHHWQHAAAAVQHGSSGGGAGAVQRSHPTEVVVLHGDAASSSLPGGGREFVFRPPRVLACVGLLFLLAGAQQQLAGQVPALEQAPAGGSGWRQLLVVGTPSNELFAARMPSWSRQAGTVIAYCSSVLYLTSRVSQIMKNHKRRSAEGLALTMFMCAIAANTLYGLSIVVRAYSLASLKSSLPWLVGSLGTVVLDMTIFAQGMMYGTEHKHNSDEEEPLLPGEGGKH